MEQSRDYAPVYFHVVVSQVHSIQVLHPSGLGVDRVFWVFFFLGAEVHHLVFLIHSRSASSY